MQKNICAKYLLKMISLIFSISISYEKTLYYFYILYIFILLNIYKNNHYKSLCKIDYKSLYKINFYYKNKSYELISFIATLIH